VDGAVAKVMSGVGAPVGVSVGVVGPEGQATWGYGRVRRDRDAAPDGRTVYEIGSVTKVFTSLVFAQLVAEGKLAPDDLLIDRLDPETTVQRFGEEPVRLEQLAMHTSGLPRLPMSSEMTFRLLGGALGDPYAWATEEKVTRSLGSTPLWSRPGETTSYSNLGVGLLGVAVGRADGRGYARALRDRVTGPLGMTDTSLVTTEALKARLAAPYRPDGQRGVSWNFGTGVEAAGALRSTAEDMNRFMAGCMSAEATSVTRALEECRRPRKSWMESKSTQIGWGFLQMKVPGVDEPAVGHDGATGGYSAFVMMFPERRSGVVVLVNQGVSSAPGRVATDVSRRLWGDGKAGDEAPPSVDEEPKRAEPAKP
jgi:CubicO group peptidase (beta-lactamase class C family)